MSAVASSLGRSWGGVAMSFSGSLAESSAPGAGALGDDASLLGCSVMSEGEAVDREDASTTPHTDPGEDAAGWKAASEASKDEPERSRP
jgi:hypothetical protein